MIAYINHGRHFEQVEIPHEQIRNGERIELYRCKRSRVLFIPRGYSPYGHDNILWYIDGQDIVRKRQNKG